MLLIVFCIFTCENLSAQISTADTAAFEMVNGKKFYLYKVSKGETISSIANKFSVKENEIKSAEGDVISKVKKKMVVRIPAPQKIFTALKDSVVETRVAKEMPSRMKVVVFLPLFYSRSYVVYDSSSESMDTLLLSESFPKETQWSLNFYEGIQYALNEMNLDKEKIDFIIIDSQNDSNVVKQQLGNARMKNCHLIIGNGNNGVMSVLNQYSLQQKIPFIVTVNTAIDIIKRNPLAIAMIPSSLMQCRKMGAACGSEFSAANYVFITTSSAKEIERTAAFREGVMSAAQNPSVRQLEYNKGGMKVLYDSLVLGKENIVFVPSSNEAFITGFLNALKPKKETYRISIVGLPTWLNLETVEPFILEEFNTQLFTSSYIDTASSEIFKMNKFYFDSYKGEPEESFYLGVDAVQILKKYFQEKFVIDRLLYKKINGFYTDYFFEKTESENCLHNSIIHRFVIEELLLKKASKIE